MSYIISYPHISDQLLIEGFSWNLKILLKICRGNPIQRMHCRDNVQGARASRVSLRGHFLSCLCLFLLAATNNWSRSCPSLQRCTPFHSVGSQPAPRDRQILHRHVERMPCTAAGRDKASCSRPLHLLSHFFVQLPDPPANTFHNVSYFPFNAIYINISKLLVTIDNIKDIRRVQITRLLHKTL